MYQENAWHPAWETLLRAVGSNKYKSSYLKVPDWWNIPPDSRRSYLQQSATKICTGPPVVIHRLPRAQGGEVWSWLRANSHTQQQGSYEPMLRARGSAPHGFKRLSDNSSTPILRAGWHFLISRRITGSQSREDFTYIHSCGDRSAASFHRPNIAGRW